MAATRTAERRLHTDEALPFSPGQEKEGLRLKFHDIPRYLFRVFSPISGAATDEKWAVSLDVRQGDPNSKIDIFNRGDNRLVADMLNRHLRWHTTGDSNIVSWTSSLLYALVYFFQIHAGTKDGSDFDDIHLCVLDTSEFLPSTFLRDIDVIRSFSLFDTGLRGLKALRLGKSQSKSSGCYYFGEYLSQGALKIENRCQIISARAIINSGLYTLLPEFEEFEDWNRDEKPPCARTVVQLRKALGPRASLATRTVEGEVNAAIRIASLFESRWRLPLVASLVALIPSPCSDGDILEAFRRDYFTDAERKACSREKTVIMAYDTLPEVQKFSDIMRSVYKDFCLTRSKIYVDRAEGFVRSALLWGGSTDSPSALDRDMTVMDPIYDDIVDHLDDIIKWSCSLRQEMLKSRMILVDSDEDDEEVVGSGDCGDYYHDQGQYEFVQERTPPARDLTPKPRIEIEHVEVFDGESFPFKNMGNREKSVMGRLYLEGI